jgi:seryl-tRNA synthetase
MENHQLQDGGFRVPAALHPFGAPEQVPGPTASPTP